MNANTTNIVPEQIAMTLNGAESFRAAESRRTNDVVSIITLRESAPDLDDKQVLDFILTLSASRERDTLAATLLDHFGSLKNVLEARPEQLRTIKGIGEKTANLIASFIPVMKAWKRRTTDLPDRIGNSREAERYCLSLTAGNRVEEFWVVCLNAQCNVLGKRRISTGSLSEVSAYPRMVMETALNYNAHSVLLTHNHPGGTCAPSPEDISSTIQLQRLLNGVGILTLDHIIVAGDITYSMVQHGDIDYRIRNR